MEIPARVSFKSLFQGELPIANWKDDIRIGESFPLPIGVGNNQEIIDIDITNDGDGNHCLVTGTTGSGKTEFIITYLLAACSKYSPDYFNFAIIDFKGGSMAEKVCIFPHCVGEYTNSGGKVTKRDISRISVLLRYEFDRRVLLCQDENCGNITEYHKKYQRNKNIPPLPYLLVVIDEASVLFSEDKKSSDYIRHLVAVGRQYGIHLMLATQSKNGVVPSQVMSNINITVEFYSEDDLKKKNTLQKGRAVINSLKKEDCVCQVALSALNAEQKDKLEILSISALNYSNPGFKSSKKKSTTEFDQVANIILSRFENFEAKTVITETLESYANDPDYFKSIKELSEHIPPMIGKHTQPEIPVGFSDNIYNGKISPYFVPWPPRNTMIYGLSGSGKTTFIQSLIISAARILFPKEINIYILTNNHDYKLYQSFPHIGSVLFDPEIYYFLLFLKNEINRRRRSGKEGYPYIIAVIDGCYNEIIDNTKWEQMLKDIASDCSKVGVYLYITSRYRPSLARKIENSFQDIYSFYMGDDFDYSSLNLHLDEIKMLPNISGRCFAKIEGNPRTLETQIIQPVRNEKDLNAQVEDWSVWAGVIPIEIPILPDILYIPSDKIRVWMNDLLFPVGLSEDLIWKFWDMGKFHSYLISYFNDESKNTLMNTMIKIAKLSGYHVVFLDGANVFSQQYEQDDKITYLASDAPQEEFLDAMNRNSNTKIILFADCFTQYFCQNGSGKEDACKHIISYLGDKSKKVYGVFSDTKISINRGRSAIGGLVQMLESETSGMLISKAPDDHTFGSKSLPIIQQCKEMYDGWGANVQLGDTAIVKLPKDVK